MGKVVDYSTYFNYLHAQRDNSLQNAVAIVDKVHPRIEAVIMDEITQMFSATIIKGEATASFDDAVILSLCGLLSDYLGELVDRPNTFNVSIDNIDNFINDLIKSMLKKMKRKENDTN
jgi:hypothetical protein